ncbi:MAG TPA: GntR family transcriptional regulator [Rectinemataceae bacterium]|nr:GntR family transcriptional regulator [Rectinemataceae bacterium]
METQAADGLDLRSLSDLVYEDLKRRLNGGSLRPGQFIDLSALGRELGMSRTPLRDALIRLELEGFVRVYPRRGVMVRSLDLADIRDIYQILGALEASAALKSEGRFRTEDADRMDCLVATMGSTLEADDFPAFYAANLAFHDVYLDLSDNRDLVRTVRTLKERLYDFPRRTAFVKEWELASASEHVEIAARFRAGDFAGAAAVIRDVHWSYEAQELFIRKYYFAAGGKVGAER